MKTTSIISLSILCLVLNVGAASANAEDQSPWIVRSDVPPQPLLINGVICHASAIPGRENEFMYVPDEVFAYGGHWRSNPGVPEGSTTTITSGQRNWRIAKTADNYTVVLLPLAQARQDQPTNQPLNLWGPAWLLVGLAVVFILGMVKLKAAFDRMGAEDEREAAERDRRRLKEEESELARKREELLRDSGNLASREAELLARREAMEAEKREQEAKLRRARASMENANQMMQRVPKEGGNKALAKLLRESYLFDQAIGEWISVVRIINPDFNGNVEFRWKLSEDMPRSTSVEVRRGSRVVKTDYGLEGELKEHITPGKRASYTFAVLDSKRPWGAPLVMEVKVPDLDVWLRQVHPDDEAEYQERYRKTIKKRLFLAEAREQAIGEVNSKDVPVDLKDWMLGVIDSVTAEFEENA